MRVDLRLQLLQLRALAMNLLFVHFLDQRIQSADHSIELPIQVTEFKGRLVGDRNVHIASLHAAESGYK
ncbi:hypothetical protein D3C79_1071100 [compost metagenome]